MSEFIEYYDNPESESESESGLESEFFSSDDEYTPPKKTTTKANTLITSASRKRKVDEIRTSNSDILKSSVRKKLKVNEAAPATSGTLKTPHPRNRCANEYNISRFDTLKSSVPKKFRGNETSTFHTLKPSVPKKRRANVDKTSIFDSLKPSVPKKTRLSEPDVSMLNEPRLSVPKKLRETVKTSIPKNFRSSDVQISNPTNQHNKKTGLLDTTVTFPGKRTANKPHAANRKENQLAPKKNKRALSKECDKPKSTKRKKKNEGWISSPFEPKLFDFDESASGLSSNAADCSSALSFFELFFDEKLIDIIVEQSNKYHYTIPVKSNDSSKRKHQKAWVDIDRNEMYVFLATFLLMASVKKSNMQDYWSRDPLIETPIFAKIMPRDRFFAVLQALHFNDNEKQPPGDRLFKIKPIMELLKERFPLYISAYKNLAIDESLMLWKGRLCFKQYIPSKRHRFGVKLFVLCDCLTGAILDFIVYTGANTEMEHFSELGISGSIVMTLLKPYLGKGHSVFLDNWYSSPALFNELHERETGACGTIKKNRTNFPEFENLERGEIMFLNKENLMAIKWQDKRDVHMLTSLHQAGFGPTKKQDYRTKDIIWKPLAVIDYNANMGPIDKSDMQISFVECVRKSVKWYKKFFFHLLDITVLNCNIMSIMKFGKKSNLGNFRNKLVRQLLSKYGKSNNPGKRTISGSSTPHPKRLIDRHFASKVASTPGQRSKTRTCFVCSHSKRKQKKRSSTRYECQDCNVGLCVPECFKDYHTLLHF